MSTPRSLAVAAALLVLAAMAWLALGGDGVEHSPGELAAPEALAVEEAVTASRVRPPHPKSATSRQEIVVEPMEEHAIGASQDAVRRATNLLATGTLVVRRPDGSVEHGLDGEIVWSVSGAWMPELRCNVRDGAWILEEKLQWISKRPWEEQAPPDQPVFGLSLVDVRVGRRLAKPIAPYGWITIPTDEPVEVVVLLPDPTVLRALDAITDKELQEVEVLAPRPDGTHPGPAAARLASRVKTPLVLRAMAGDLGGPQDRLLGAPGYQWTPVRVDFATGGEHLVRLERAGDLLLRFAGEQPRGRFTLDLRRPGDRLPQMSIVLDGTEPLLVERLPPGPYTLRAQAWTQAEGELDVGGAQADVVAGEQVHATIELATPRPPEPASPSGVLLVAPEWRAEGLELLLWQPDAPPATRGAPLRKVSTRLAERIEGCDAFRWSASGIPSGRYELWVNDPPCAFALDIPPGRGPELRLRVPDPCELLVRAVDELTGKPLPLERVRWEPRPGLRLDAQHDSVRGGHLLLAPRGQVLLHATGDLVEHSEQVVLREARQEHVLRVRRTTELEIVLLDGSARIPIPAECGASVEPRHGSGGGAYGARVRDGRLRCTLRAGGEYIVQVDPVPGYATPSPRAVEAQPGARTVVEVPLIRVP